MKARAYRKSCALRTARANQDACAKAEAPAGVPASASVFSPSPLLPTSVERELSLYCVILVAGSLQSLRPVLPPIAHSSSTQVTPAVSPLKRIAREFLNEIDGPNSLPLACLIRPWKL